MAGHTLSDPDRVVSCTLERSVRKNGQELIAPISRHEVHRASLARKNVPNGAQHLVTHEMPERVVVPLEIVEIEKDHSQSPAPPSRR